jgi:hypothetical protein
MKRAPDFFPMFDGSRIIIDAAFHLLAIVVLTAHGPCSTEQRRNRVIPFQPVIFLPR